MKHDKQTAIREKLLDELKANVAVFEAINKLTPWSENPPHWWLDWSEQTRRNIAAIALAEKGR